MIKNDVEIQKDFDVYPTEVLDTIKQKGLLTNTENSPISLISTSTYRIDYTYKKLENDIPWGIELDFGTFEFYQQLQIKIMSDHYELKRKDDYLEVLKFTIKDVLKSDWKNIIWLVDKDAEILSTEIYPCIYRVENLMRQLINEVMTKKFGIAWWNSYVPMEIQEKHRQRIKKYKQIVDGFKNVDEKLMSIDVGDLRSILEIEIKEWTPKFDLKINDFINGISSMNLETLKNKLLEQSIVKKNLWSEYFCKYLPEDFIESFEKLKEDRNHIAHNKLLDRHAYNTIYKLAQDIEEALKKALNKVEMELISTERKQDLMWQEEHEQQKEEQYLKYIAFEYGVNIRSSNGIINLYNEYISEFHSDLHSNLRFRNDIEISDYKDISLENECGELFKMIYKINQKELTINYNISIINDTQGDESTIDIVASTADDEENLFKTPVDYTNGEISFYDDQATYMPRKEDFFNTSALEELMIRTLEIIDIKFPNMREEIDLNMYSIIKDGGLSPVAEELACQECGEDYICVDQDYGVFGQCLNCGEINEINECERCQCHYESYENSDVCESCLDYIMNM